jgi:two-component system phosphate regulon sensor histidine kinase PhoR
LEFLSIISDESDRLTNLVNNLLDLSRIEVGTLKLAHEKCDVNEVIQSAVRGARLTQKNKVDITIKPKFQFLYADPLRLESILRNLIENSIKYAGEDAQIKVEVNKNGKEVVFHVRDNGPGIPQKEGERVFERFYRVDDSLTRLTSGAGLGLAICQGLVRAHGGKIWVEQEEMGACIAFTIPANSKRKTSSSKNSKKKVSR